MAFHDNTFQSRPRGLGDILAAPFLALVRGFVWLGENSAYAKQLHAISAMTDAQLAARGLTREQAVAAIFRHDA
jgi:hypothetical protein